GRGGIGLLRSRAGKAQSPSGRFGVGRSGVALDLQAIDDLGVEGPAGRLGLSDQPRPLEVLTKALDVAVGDEAGGEAEKGFVDVVSSFPADTQAAKAVQPGDGAFDDPAEGTQARTVRLAAFRNHGPDA